MAPRILFILTSCGKDLKGGQTGWYLPELSHPYSVFDAAGCSIDFGSLQGPNPPVDQGSVEAFKDDASFLDNKTVKFKLETCQKLLDVNLDDYDVIYYVGGHGPVIDLPEDAVNIKLASEFYRSGKITSAVCHGPAALVGATDAEGKSIFAGKKFTGFSNAEEEKGGTVSKIPFLLEDKIQGLGGTYEKASELWGPHVVVSGNLYTGQNPASAKPLAEEILKSFN